MMDEVVRIHSALSRQGFRLVQRPPSLPREVVGVYELSQIRFALVRRGTEQYTLVALEHLQ